MRTAPLGCSIQEAKCFVGFNTVTEGFVYRPEGPSQLLKFLRIVYKIFFHFHKATKHRNTEIISSNQGQECKTERMNKTNRNSETLELKSKPVKFCACMQVLNRYEHRSPISCLKVWFQNELKDYHNTKKHWNFIVVDKSAACCHPSLVRL